MSPRDRAQACDACDGTGRIGVTPAPRRETSATTSADAFQRHVARLFPDVAAADERGGDADDLSALDDLSLLQRLLDIDQQYVREMLNATPGRATPETATRIGVIADDYRRIAALDRDAPLDQSAMERKIADALRLQGQAYELVSDLDAAETVYEQSVALYRRLGAVAEADGVDASLRELRLYRDRDVDDAVATLRAQLDAADGDAVDRAAAQVELAEIHMTRHDDLEAEELFLAAKEGLEPFREHITGEGTARSLTASLSAIMSGVPQSAVPSIETVMRVRGLLQRIYAGMTQLLRDVDPDGAREYLALRSDMEGSIDDGSAQNRQFSDAMLGSLESLLEQFDRDVGGRG